MPGKRGGHVRMQQIMVAQSDGSSSQLAVLGRYAPHLLQASPFPSVAGAASLVCQGFTVNKMSNEVFF